MIDHHQTSRLRNLHQELKQRVLHEQRRPNPDVLLIQRLKRQKLQLKDQLSLAQAGLAPATARNDRN